MRRLISQRSGIWNTTKWSTCSIPMVVLVVRKVMLMELQMDPKGCRNSPYWVHRHTPIQVSAPCRYAGCVRAPASSCTRFRFIPPACRPSNRGNCRLRVSLGDTPQRMLPTILAILPLHYEGYDIRIDSLLPPRSPCHRFQGCQQRTCPTLLLFTSEVELLDEHLHFAGSQLFTGSLH